MLLVLTSRRFLMRLAGMQIAYCAWRTASDEHLLELYHKDYFSPEASIHPFFSAKNHSLSILTVASCEKLSTLLSQSDCFCISTL